MRELLLTWTRSSKILTSRRRSVSRNRKSRKRTGFYEEDRSPSWSTTPFEWLAFMMQFSITLICFPSLFVTTMLRDSIQDGTKFYFLCQRFHPTMSWKVCTNEEFVSPCNSKPYWNCARWRFSRRCRHPFVRNWKRWWKAVWENRNWSSGQESKGLLLRWKSKRYMLPVERRRPMFEGIPVMIVHQNRHRKPLHLLSYQWHEVEARRGKKVSRTTAILVSFFDNRIDTIWKVLARDRLVTIGSLPNVNFKTESGCKAGDKCLFPHYKVEEQPSKKPQKRETSATSLSI